MSKAIKYSLFVVLYVAVGPFAHLRADTPTGAASLESYVDSSVADGTVAGGSLLVLRRGEVVFHSGFGYADLETKTPFEKETPVVIASISKPLLGTAIFRLAESRKLEIDAPISQFLPEFQGIKLETGEVAPRAPSLRELLSHTAGTRASEAESGRPWLSQWTRGKTLADVVSRYAREFPLRAPPGSRYAYSGIGTDIAARTAEVLAAQPRNELLQAHVAIPLGMKQTGYNNAQHHPANLSTRYWINGEGKLTKVRSRPIPPVNTYSSSGGSIISTASDLAIWLMMIRNDGMHAGDEFLSENTILEMLTPVPNSRNTACGFFARKKAADGRPTVIGHTGSTGTNCWIDFENDIIGIMLTQTRGKDIVDFRKEIEARVTAAFSRE